MAPLSAGFAARRDRPRLRRILPPRRLWAVRGPSARASRPPRVRWASLLRFSPACVSRWLRTPSPVLQLPTEHVVRGRRIELVTPALVTAVHGLGKHLHVWSRRRRGARCTACSTSASTASSPTRSTPCRGAGRARRPSSRPVTAAGGGATRHATAPSRRQPGAGAPRPDIPQVSVALVALITIVAFEAMAISTAMPARRATSTRSAPTVSRSRCCSPRSCSGIVLAGVWVDRSGPLPSRSPARSCWPAAPACAPCRVAGALPAGRAVTGLGAGLIVVTGYVLVGRTYPDATRPRVFTYCRRRGCCRRCRGRPSRPG